jgi:GT2 family glycosyltransferase
MGFAIVTPTSGRPECFSLLEKWVKQQSYAGPILWVVATDDDENYAYGDLPANIERVVLRREPDGHNSLASNLILALEYLRAKEIPYPVAIFEDDDHVHCDYLTLYAQYLSNGAYLVGEANARYYNVRERRFRTLNNLKHASLAQTAFRPEVIPDAIEAARQHLDTARTPSIDATLWKMDIAERHLHAPKGVHVSVKGMPGKAGYGIGHREEFGQPDYYLDAFRAWNLPLEYALYMDPPIRFANDVYPFGGLPYPSDNDRHMAASNVAIGMVMRNQGKMTRDAVRSVLSTTEHLDPQFMVWDNGSTEPEALELLDDLEKMTFFRVFRATEGAGWIRAINHMARFSTAPFFVGLNNDIIAHPGWCDALLAPFADDPQIMETGPRPQCGFLAPNFHGRPGKGTPDYIEGWCFCVSRKAIELFGPYDEYHLKGFYGDDSDLSLRIKHCGYKIAVAEGCKVDHLGSATLKSSKDERALMLGHEGRNLTILRERWSDYPTMKAGS